MRDRTNEAAPINFTPDAGAPAYRVASAVPNPSVRVPFGKHKGRLLSQVPADGLVWLNAKLSQGFLKNQVVLEMNRRESERTPATSHISEFRR